MTDFNRCEWCGGVVVRKSRRGRPPRFCKRSHRQRHYEARRLAGASGLKPGEALVSTAAIEAMRDSVYLLQAAVEDAEADLAEEASIRTYTEAFRSLHEAAHGVIAIRIEPKAMSSDDPA